MIVKELIIDDGNDELGVYAVSLVSRPAIETPFQYFNDQQTIKLGRRQQKAVESGVNLDEFWVYTAEPDTEIIPTSHKFCKQKAGNVYHISEIKGWAGISQAQQEDYKFILDSPFFANFNGESSNKNIDQQIYGCRHHFRRVRNVNEIPNYKRQLFKKDEKVEMADQKIILKVSDKEKHEISGVALRSGQFIYRKDIDEQGDGYVYFSRETIRKIKERYGFNRTISIEHSMNATGSCILLNTWLVENDDENFTEWYLHYKVIDNTLWEAVKNEAIIGFSIEALLTIK
jgi:hypothetical protein